MHGVTGYEYGRTDAPLSTTTAPGHGQEADRRELPPVWAIRLQSRETGRCLDIDGIVLTWFSRYPDDAVHELMDGRDPEEWQPLIERLTPSEEDFPHLARQHPHRNRRARRLRLGAGVVRDDAPYGNRNEPRREMKFPRPVRAFKVTRRT